MIYCELCQASFSTHYSWESHLKQQKHIEFVAERERRNEVAQRSIFVTGFPPGMPSMFLARYFKQFGPLYNPVMDREKGAFAIIEFHEKFAVDRILYKKNHILNGCRLSVKPRRFKQREPNKKAVRSRKCPTNEMNYTEVIDLLLNQPDGVIQMFLLADALRLTKEDKDERENICQFFKSVFSDFFIFSDVSVFGSTANSLGKRGCDLDLLLSLKEECDDTKVNSFADISDEQALEVAQDVVERNYRKLTVEELEKLTSLDIINLVKSIIKKRGVQCSQIFVIPSKRCPIVRFNIQRKTNISVDLSIKNRLSLYNSKLVELFMQSDERIPPLTFTIKYWVYRRDLTITQANRLSSYSAILLVIFYLQNTNPPILPPVEKLRQSLTESRIQGGWECNFSEDLDKFPQTENTENLMSLLNGFFDFYNLFDFSSNVVCPCTGIATPKDEMKTTISCFNVSKYLCVQDPFDLSHNTTANIDDFLTAKIIQAFSDASNLFESGNIWKKKVNGQPWGLICLFDNVGDSNNESAFIDLKPDVKELEAKQKEQEQKESPAIDDEDAHLANNSKLVLTVFNSCHVEHFRMSIPNRNGETTDSTSEWFRRVCKAVHDVFSIALQFSCTPENSGLDKNKRKSETEDPRNNKRMRMADGSFNNRPSCSSTMEESWDDHLERRSAEKSLTRFDRFVCHVYHRTWAGRKKASNVIKQYNCSVLQTEEMVSKHIIGNSKSKSPLYSFLCKVKVKPLPEVELALIALSNSAELKANAFSFLQSYVPKLLKQMEEAKEIL